MTNQELMQRAQAVLFQNYRTQPIALLRGEGTHVFDAEGKKYLDFIGGIATVSVGHCNPRVREALIEQSKLIWHASNLYLTEPQVRLAEKLTSKTRTLKRAFFCNSGTEANEALIKMARHFHVVNGQPERIEILCFNNSFHGRTMGSLAATGQPKYQQGFGPLPQGFKFLDYGNLEQLEKSVGPQTCAVFMEPVQGEAGVMPLPPGYLKKARELCDKFGAILLLDEVQTGMGRTGAYFAHQHERIEPDAMSLAKGIAGGMPLGGILATEKLAACMTPGTHASTFGGNPLATAAACAVMELLEGGLIERVQQAGARLSQRLSEIRSPRIAGERGSGLLRALLLSDDVAGKVVVAAREGGLLVNAIGERVIRLAPPLTVSDGEIDQAARLLAEAVAKA
jgi:acetylornithine/N-succinyldiaminopimelate aminotransferase